MPGFGAGFEIALEPLKLQKEGANLGKGHFYFLRQILVCSKPWFERYLNIWENRVILDSELHRRFSYTKVLESGS